LIIGVNSGWRFVFMFGVLVMGYRWSPSSGLLAAGAGCGLPTVPVPCRFRRPAVVKVDSLLLLSYRRDWAQRGGGKNKAGPKGLAGRRGTITGGGDGPGHVWLNRGCDGVRATTKYKGNVLAAAGGLPFGSFGDKATGKQVERGGRLPATKSRHGKVSSKVFRISDMARKSRTSAPRSDKTKTPPRPVKATEGEFKSNYLQFKAPRGRPPW